MFPSYANLQTPEKLQSIENSIAKTNECIVEVTKLHATLKAKHAALKSQPTDSEIATELIISDKLINVQENVSSERSDHDSNITSN